MDLSKSQLRSCLSKVRDEFVIIQNCSWHAAKTWPQSLIDLALGATCVAGYVPVKSEADVTSLLHDLAALGVSIALPYLASRNADLVFREYVKNDVLDIAAHGFRQPKPMMPICEPDVILTPLIGFDRTMSRLGQGAGHYDRAFARNPAALRIGVAWSVQEDEEIPTDPWDVALDAVLTEKEWIIGPQSRISA